MNLYRIEQSVNNCYDTYDSAIVVAETEEAARLTHPDGRNWDGKKDTYSAWCTKEDVKVELIGVAADGIPSGVICASFNAG